MTKVFFPTLYLHLECKQIFPAKEKVYIGDTKVIIVLLSFVSIALVALSLSILPSFVSSPVGIDSGKLLRS